MEIKKSVNQYKIIVLAFFIVMGSTAAYYYTFDNNISGFFLIGEKFPKSPFLDRDSSHILKNESGYDGQQFLTLGFDPLMQHSGTLDALDNPRYRSKRILLPVLSRLLSFGQNVLVPYNIVLINAVSIFLMVILFSIYGESYQKRILLILAIPGLWIVLRISTAEILANLLILLSYLLLSKVRHRLAMFTVGLACLAKETMLIFAASYAVVYLIRDRKILLEMPLLFSPFIVWHTYLIHRFGLGGDFDEAGNLVYPFYGIYEKFQILLTEENNKHEYIFFIILCLSVIFLLTKIKEIIKDHPYLILGTLSYLLLFSLSSRAIYDYHLSYNRVFIPIFLILLLVQKQKMKKIDLCFWTISSLSAIRVVYWIVH